MPELKTRLLLAGGGSGGHVWPGVALADTWTDYCKKHGKKAEILFVGAHGGMEVKLIPTTSYPLELLSIGSLKRVTWTKKMQTLWRLPIALFKSLLILLRFKPEVVVGIGGYASGPVVLVASLFGRFLGIKTAILEPNAVSGFTNRCLSHFVDRIYMNPFNQAVQKSSSEKVLYSGTPIRGAFSPLAFRGEGKFTLFIFGGSQGALGMNTLIMNSLRLLGSLKDQIEIIHQTGEVDFERVSKFYQEMNWPQVRVEKFIHDMKSMYLKASLVVCRAGAGSIAEIIQVRRPAILVPLPTAADNHQEWNARGLAELGAAVMVHQNKTPPEELAQLLQRYVQNPKLLLDMTSKLERFSRPNAAQAVVEDLTRL